MLCTTYRLRNGIMSVINAEVGEACYGVMGRRTRSLFTCSETINRPARPLRLLPPSTLFLLSASAENGLATRQSLQGCVASPYELLTTFMSHTYDESLKRATTQTLCISQEKSAKECMFEGEREGLNEGMGEVGRESISGAADEQSRAGN